MVHGEVVQRGNQTTHGLRSECAEHLVQMAAAAETYEALEVWSHGRNSCGKRQKQFASPPTEERRTREELNKSLAKLEGKITDLREKLFQSRNSPSPPPVAASLGWGPSPLSTGTLSSARKRSGTFRLRSGGEHAGYHQAPWRSKRTLAEHPPRGDRDG